MIYITDILGIFNNGKVNPDAREQISKMKETDSLVILSDNGEMTVNGETLALLTSNSGKTDIAKCSGTSQLIFVVGKYMGAGETVRICVKNPEIAKSLDFLKNEDKVSFGWKNVVKKKTKTATVKKEKVVVKAEEKTDDDFMAVEAPAEPEVKASPKKAPKKEKKADPVSDDVTSDEVRIAKEILGAGFTKEEYKTAVMLAKKSGGDELAFRAKLSLAIPYSKYGENLVDGLRELQEKVK